MKRLILALLFVSAIISSCSKDGVIPNGIIVKEERDLSSSYNRISVTGGLDVTIEKTGSTGVMLKGDSNIIPYIKTTVSDNVLYIGFKSGTVISGKPTLDIRIAFDELNMISASGGSKIEIDGLITSSEPSLDIMASGGSRVEIIRGAITGYETVRAEITGGSDINILGTCSTLKTNLSGGSRFRGFNFQCDYLDALMSGGSIIDVTCNDIYDLTATGGCKIELKGTARPGKYDVSGGCDVKLPNSGK